MICLGSYMGMGFDPLTLPFVPRYQVYVVTDDILASECMERFSVGLIPLYLKVFDCFVPAASSILRHSRFIRRSLYLCDSLIIELPNTML